MFNEDLLSIQENIILIGYPSKFAEESFFTNKTAQILNNLKDFLIIAIDDNHDFIKRNYPAHVLQVISSKDITDKEVIFILKKITHCIIYWDGDELTKFVFEVLISHKPHKIIPVKTTKVANKDRGEEYDVYIGRRGPWGNPFVIGKDGDREEVIEKYRKYFYESILSDNKKKNALLALKGVRLGCHCKPFPCHGDVIAEYLNKLEIFAE